MKVRCYSEKQWLGLGWQDVQCLIKSLLEHWSVLESWSLGFPRAHFVDLTFEPFSSSVVPRKGLRAMVLLEARQGFKELVVDSCRIHASSH